MCSADASAGDAAHIDLRVKRYFPRVKDFERNEKGDVIFHSLSGPEKLEVREAPKYYYAREARRQRTRVRVRACTATHRAPHQLTSLPRLRVPPPHHLPCGAGEATAVP